jgi:transcriptional regulator with XRE-family HTH domain
MRNNISKGGLHLLLGERLKNLRAARGWTQDETARMLGISRRTLQKYEAGAVYPRHTSTYQKMGEVFGINPASLISDEDQEVMFAIEKGGSRSGRDVQALITDVGALFAGGELSEEDKDKVLRAITDLYWHAKEKNRKYTSKKYLTENNQA